jgi:thioesterase domain-containing protein
MVGLLALLDTGSPDFARQMDDLEDGTTLLGIIARELNLTVRDADLRPLSLDQQLLIVVEHMKAANLHWEDAAGFLKRQLAIFQARNKVVREYHPGPYDGMITFFRAGTADIEFEGRELPEIFRDPTRGFAALTTQTPEVHVVPGSHHQMAKEPGVQVLAALLAGCIEKAMRAAEKQMSFHD